VQRPGSLASNERFTGSGDTPPKAVLGLRPVVAGARPLDAKDTVWLAGSGQKDAQLLTFTREGKFLRQFGKPGMNNGSADTNNMGQPANLTVDPMSNEVYVADGCGNRRVSSDGST
jgi:hypothetical protein